jgi:hypothetical protein
MRHLLAVLFTLAASPAFAQPEVDALTVYVGASPSTCAIRSGTGAPAGSLGEECDIYFRHDSPFTIYVKTGASTWTQSSPSSGTVGDLFYGGTSNAFSRLPSVASGQVLTSAGAGTAPAWSASPSLTGITGAANLTISPTGDVVFNPTGNDILPTTGYDLNNGALTNKFLTLHAAELWVETLVAQNTMATIGGRILVGPTTTLTSDLGSGATSIVVKHNQMASGDRVVMQANGQLEWMAVTSGPSGSGPYTYSVTRNLDGSGANDWTAGDAVFNTGTTNDGYIDLYSVSGILPGSTAGPTITGNVRTGSTYTDVATRWAIGNLNGLYGYATDIYGAAFGNPSGSWAKIDGTNGLRLGHNATTNVEITAAGQAQFAGDIIGGGVIRSSGASAFGTGTGFWLNGSGTPTFRVGNPAANRLSWDGTNLTLVSANATIDSSGVRITPGTILSNDGAFGFQFAGTGALGGTYASELGSIQVVSTRNVVESGGTAYTGMSSSVSGGATVSFELQADASNQIAEVNAATLRLGASAVTHFGPTGAVDLSIFTNAGTTTANPYIRSTDGNSLVIESRSAANGGTLFLNADQVANVSIAAGGGSSYLYNPRFQHAPLWENGLAQTTVGAAGAGAALPATPAGYLKVNFNGTPYVIPVYNP